MTECDTSAPVTPGAVGVGPAVRDGVGHGLHPRVRCPAGRHAKKTCNTAHMASETSRGGRGRGIASRRCSYRLGPARCHETGEERAASRMTHETARCGERRQLPMPNLHGIGGPDTCVARLLGSEQHAPGRGARLPDSAPAQSWVVVHVPGSAQARNISSVETQDE